MSEIEFRTTSGANWTQTDGLITTTDNYTIDTTDWKWQIQGDYPTGGVIYTPPQEEDVKIKVDGKWVSLQDVVKRNELLEKIAFFLLHNIPKDVWGRKGERAMQLLGELMKTLEETQPEVEKEEEGPKLLDEELFNI